MLSLNGAHKQIAAFLAGPGRNYSREDRARQVWHDLQKIYGEDPPPEMPATFPDELDDFLSGGMNSEF